MPGTFRVEDHLLTAAIFPAIYSDITERKRNEEEMRTARDAAEEASRTIEAADRDLKAALHGDDRVGRKILQ